MNDKLQYDVSKFPAYKIVEAKSREEAIRKSPFFIGQKARVARIQVIPAGRERGICKWSVFADFTLEDTKVKTINRIKNQD